MFKYKNVDFSLLLIRISLALVFIMHGWAKWQNIPGTTNFFGNLGLSAFFVYLVICVEFIGGIMILLGIATRYASSVLAINMLFAIILTKIGKPLMGGFEFDFILLLALIAIVFSGAGRYSVDAKGSSIEHIV